MENNNYKKYIKPNNDQYNFFSQKEIKWLLKTINPNHFLPKGTQLEFSFVKKYKI